MFYIIIITRIRELSTKILLDINAKMLYPIRINAMFTFIGVAIMTDTDTVEFTNLTHSGQPWNQSRGLRIIFMFCSQ